MPEADPSTSSAHTPAAPDSVCVQILATEHWGQLATRSMLWNEIFARAGMFLTTLSAAVVALALVAQTSDFGDEFRLFALMVLPVVLFVGIATHIRLATAVELDAWTVIGMNRLRHAYLEVAPDLEPYIINSHYDDIAGLLQSSGQYTGFRPGMAVSSTSTIVAMLNAVVAGVLAALVTDATIGGLGRSTTVGFVAGLGTAVYMAGVIPFQTIRRAQQSYVPRFPRPGAMASSGGGLSGDTALPT